MHYYKYYLHLLLISYFNNYDNMFVLIMIKYINKLGY